MRDRLTTLVSPLSTRACRALFGAQLISGLGDWAGRLALAKLVFDRSDSAWWAAAVTIVSLLPWLGPGQLLATLADHFGRVTIMIGADLLRAGLFVLMLVPQRTELLLVWAFAAGLCVPPFVGSRSSALVEVTPSDQYPHAIALYGVLSQTEILIGYAVGGLVIALTGAQVALAANAVTFVVSAALLLALRSTPAAQPNRPSQLGWKGVQRGIAVWRGDRVCLRALQLYVGVSMFMILPEALVVPFTDEVGVPGRLVGVFAALLAIGSITGMLFVPTAPSHEALLRRAAWRGAVLAAASGLLFVVGGNAWFGAIAYVLSGSVDAIAVPTNQVVGERLPTTGRAAAMSVAGGVQYASQVLAITAAGIVATVVSTRAPLAVAMLLAVGVCGWALVRPVVRRTAAWPPPAAAARVHAFSPGDG